MVRVFTNGSAKIVRVLVNERSGEERPAQLPKNGIKWRQILWLPTPRLRVECDEWDGAGFPYGVSQVRRQLEIEYPRADVDCQNATVGR